MPDTISREVADLILGRMGYEIIGEEHGFVLYVDSRYPGDPLKFDFTRGSVPWDDFVKQLEHDGVNVNVFWAELESL